MLPVLHFDNLLGLLEDAQADPTHVNALRSELSKSRPQFERLLQFPGPSASEKQTLESGASCLL